MSAIEGGECRVGFVGVGNQGGPIALRIVRAGYPLTVWARRPEALQEFVGEGAHAAGSLRELGAASDLVGVCVTTDDDVRAVSLGQDGLVEAMVPGSSLAIHSTVHPDTIREVAAAAAARQVSVLDAPVSGGRAAAIDGKLAVLVGGAPETVDRWRPVLATFASTIEVLGGLGAGQICKLVNNALSAAIFGTSLRAIVAAEELGVDRDAVHRVIRAASGDSFMWRVIPAMNADGLKLAAARYRKDLQLLEGVLGDTEEGGRALAEAAEVALDQLESFTGSSNLGSANGAEKTARGS